VCAARLKYLLYGLRTPVPVCQSNSRYFWFPREQPAMVGGVDSLLVAAGKLVTAVKPVNCKPPSRRTNNRRPGKQAVPELANSSAERGRSGELGTGDWGAGELD